MMIPKITCGALAMLGSACLPISASAATLPETVTVPAVANTSLSGGGLGNFVTTNVFNEFNPSLGTLTGISATITGSFVWTVNGLPDGSNEMNVELDTPSGFRLVTSSNYTVSATGMFTESLSLNASTTDFDPVVFPQFDGTGTTDLRLQFIAVPDFTDSAFSIRTNALSGSITYAYTPAATPVPEPSALPLFATGLGALGLLGWRRKRKAQAVA